MNVVVLLMATDAADRIDCTHSTTPGNKVITKLSSPSFINKKKTSKPRERPGECLYPCNVSVVHVERVIQKTTRSKSTRQTHTLSHTRDVTKIENQSFMHHNHTYSIKPLMRVSHCTREYGLFAVYLFFVGLRNPSFTPEAHSRFCV